MNLPSWFTKVTGAWATIGALLITFGIKGPEWLPIVFSEPFVQATSIALGAVITYFQYLRGIFAAKSEVNSLSSTSSLSYILNPFKI